MAEPFTAKIDYTNLHVCIRTRDMARSLAFYRDLVGLQVVRWMGDKDNPASVWLPGVQIRITPDVGEGQPDPYLDHIGLSLLDLDEVHNRLLAAGHTPERPYGKAHFPSVNKEVLNVFYRDPDGYLVELLQWL